LSNTNSPTNSGLSNRTHGQSTEGKLPRWNLQNIYPSLDSREYEEDVELLKKLIKELESQIEGAESYTFTERAKVLTWLKSSLTLLNKTYDLQQNLETYAYLIYSTDSYNRLALEKINLLEEVSIPLKRIAVSFRDLLKKLNENLTQSESGGLQKLVERDSFLRDYSFFLKEQTFFSEHQMSPAEEELAGDLARAGADAWGRLQEVISSQLKVIWDETTGEEKTVTQLRALAHESDREIRKKAYLKELEAWESMKTPLAFAINGVKGFSVILNRRRNFKNTLERSIAQSRITENTLDALITSMKKSLPLFRDYLKTKANLLGIEKLSFYDIFAPVGKAFKKWNYSEARNFIVEQFGDFSQELAEFASTAFQEGWIDAEPRDGKIGGAYCATVPLQKESRILCNFDGSFSSVSTIAHELGHGYHHHVLRDTPHLLRTYPMTLAETASIFCENIVFNRALEKFEGQEKLNALDVYLADSTQVIVDILSRFIFESEIIKIREEKELSVDELNDIMLKAQRETYGDALNPKELHPYMWAVKGHYYNAEFAFYNFPYAFGLLFGISLYARFLEEGKRFADTYRKLLASTGMKSANQITREAGFDIETVDFWDSGIKIIQGKIKEFRKLVEGESQ